MLADGRVLWISYWAVGAGGEVAGGADGDVVAAAGGVLAGAFFAAADGTGLAGGTPKSESLTASNS